MYRCTECGNEYEIKPQYCDCGNNTFEEIKTPPKQSQTPQSVESVSPQRRSEINNSDYKYREQQKSGLKYSNIANRRIEPISGIIFLFCIICSVIIIFFVGNPKETSSQDTSKKKIDTAQNNINIPSVDSFWNSSTKGVISDTSDTQTVPAQSQQAPMPNRHDVSTQTPAVQKQIVYVHDIPAPIQSSKTSLRTNNIKPQSVSKQTSSRTPQKTSTKIPSKHNATKTVSPFSSITSKIVNNYSNNVISKAPVPQNTNNKSSTTTTAAKTPKPSSTTPSQTINSAAAKHELSNYKISLQNTIGRKIDFTRVIGDGECSVSFKIAPNGRLTNRTFSKQSSNITLNDAVYAAMMSTPSYNAPPSAYHNETLKLNVKFYNGNFTINLN